MRKKVGSLFGLLATAALSTSLLAGCGKNKVETIQIEKGTLQYDYVVGDDAGAFDNLKIVVKYSDGSTKTLTKDDVTIETDFTTETAGTYPVKIKYEGQEITINLRVVSDAMDLSTIISFELDSTRTEAMEVQDNKEEEFFNRDNPYYVGDDNQFTIDAIVKYHDEDADVPGTMTSYKSVSKIELIEGNTATLLTGDTLASYVDVKPLNATYDFTDDAVGKTFKITVQPDCTLYTCYTGVKGKSVTVNVVDGYNVTDAKELLLLGNAPQDNREEKTGNYVSEVNTFLSNNNIERPQNLRALVLQNDITITNNDLPNYFFEDASKTYLKDYLDIYNIRVDTDTEFTIYGNYFTLDASNIAKVGVVSDAEDSGARVSHSTLMKVEMDPTAPASKNLTTKFTVRDLKTIGNGHRTNTTDGFGGLIYTKAKNLVTTFDNVIMRSYYINSYADTDDVPGTCITTLNLTNVKSYDPYQDFVYSWGGQNINITNADFARAGGPAMILQHRYSPDSTTGYADFDAAVPVATLTNVTIDNGLVGNEAWFNSLPGLSSIAGYIKSLNGLITSDHGSTTSGSFLDKDGMMNIMAVNMSIGMTATGAKAQGLVAINGNIVSSMMDSSVYAIKDGKVTIDGVTYTYDAENNKLTNATYSFTSFILDEEEQRIVKLNGRQYALQNMGGMYVLADITDKLAEEADITEAYVIYDYDEDYEYKLHKISYAIASQTIPNLGTIKVLIDNPVAVLASRADPHVIAVLDETTGTFYSVDSTSPQTLEADIAKFGYFITSGNHENWQGEDAELEAMVDFKYFTYVDSDDVRQYALYIGELGQPTFNVIFAGKELGDKIAFIDVTNGINGIDYLVNVDTNANITSLTDLTTKFVVTYENTTVIDGFTYKLSTNTDINSTTSAGYEYYKELKSTLGRAIPVFESSAGGLAYYNGSELIVLDEDKFFEGDYLTIYFNGMAILLQYYH